MKKLIRRAMIGSLLILALSSLSGACRQKEIKDKAKGLLYRGVDLIPGERIEEVIDRLGERIGYEEIKSCAGEGVDKIYDYESIELHTREDNGKERIISVIVKDRSIPTPEGLRVGDDIVKAKEIYGDKLESNPSGNRFKVKREGYDLIVFSSDGKVSRVRYEVSDLKKKNAAGS